MMRLFLIFICWSFSFAIQAADLEVTVEGVEAVRGDLLIGIYDNKKDFRKKPIPGSPKIPIDKKGTVTATIKDLKPGTYAVIVIWDLNRNGKLDTGALKMPLEPLAFSNNPKIPFGPPPYRDCTFVLTEKGKKLHMVLRKK